jgi:SAM-dependent methyltransferase
VTYRKLAEIYDQVFADEGFYRRYGRLVRRICRTFDVRPARTLDIACGTGRLARYLPGETEGIDESASMVRIARRRMRAHRGTMTRFRVRRPVDLAVCTFDALNHLRKPELVKAFRCVRRSLRAGGLYIFDLNTDVKINAICPSYLGRQFRAGGCEVFWLNRTSPGRWESRITIFEPKGKLWKRHEERIVETAFSLKEVRQALRRARLTCIGEYGDMNMGPLKPTVERWFFAARRDDGSRY